MVFDLAHVGKRIGVEPSCVLDLGFIGGDGVVGGVTFVRTMRFGIG